MIISLSLSLRFKLSSSISLFSVIWVCRSIILFGFFDLLFGFVDLFFGFVVVDLLNRWFWSLGLCSIIVFSVEIKADCYPPKLDLTRPMAFHSRWF